MHKEVTMKCQTAEEQTSYQPIAINRAEEESPHCLRQDEEVTRFFTAMNSDTIALQIPADLAFVHLISRCACGVLERYELLADAEITLYNLELAIQEIGVNIVTHAYTDSKGHVLTTVRCDEEARQLIITLEDEGKSFDPTKVADPELGTLQEHGFGLFLARELLDDLSYESIGKRNRWRLCKSFAFGQE